MSTLYTFCKFITAQKIKKMGVPIFFKSLMMVMLLGMLSTHSFSQSSGWSSTMETQKVFIENQGQFDNAPTGDAVLYAFFGGSTSIYFTKKGVSYTFLKRWAKEKDANEREEKFTTAEEWKEKEAEERRMEYESDMVSMTWADANLDVEVIGYDKTSDYHSFCIKDKDGKITNKNFIKAFKKIVYKNIYPGIDIEYVFHPDGGLKYAVILHPGADISKVRMNYSVAPEIAINGDVHLPTKFGDIIDHAPATFYADMKSKMIASHFIKNGNSISFAVSSFDITKNIVIDPWTQTPAMPNSNGVWECERDGAGNVYIIGGEMPMKLIKYNSTGALQWTYSTPYDTASSWLGTFATDLAGNSYVTQGSIAALQKIDANGGVVYTWNASLFSVDEYWNIAFNCDQTKLIIGGTSGTMLGLHGAIFYIDVNNGSVLSNQTVAYGSMFGIPPSIQEVRSITSCRNSRYYFLTLDTLGCIDDTYNACASPSVFKMNHGYHFSYRSENYKMNTGNSGMMCIRANKNFVYTQNGSVIEKRSLIDGSVITSVPIPGGSTITDPLFGQHQAGNAGIDIDSCGNVYVGSSDGIYKFDADLNLISSIQTPFKVYDVAVSINGDVIFCGSTGTAATNGNRNGEVQSANMSACLPMVLECCDANICPAGPICNNAGPISLTGGTPGGTWSGPGVDPTGIFDPGVAGAGTITITYTLACGSGSINIIVNPCGCPTVTPTATNIIDVCTGQTNGSFTVNTSGGTPPYNYTLLDGATPIATYNNISGSQEFTGLAAGSYTLNVIDSNGCPGNITVTIASLTSLAPVISGPTSICSGNTATLDVGAGYTSYLWSTNAATQTINVGAGTYSVSVTNGSGCSGSASITVTTFSMTVNLTPQDAGCPGTCDGSITTNVIGGSAPYTYLWSNGQTTPNIIGLCAGNYAVTVTDSNSCTKITNATINSENISASFIANPESGALPLSVAFTYTGSGAVSWYWDFGNGHTSTEQYPPIQTYDTVGSYNVTLIVSTGAPDFCKDTAHVVIEVQKPSSLIIPNIITPNGDGHNDEFILLYKEIETFTGTIFNRWGKKIFEWTDISKGWNGITNGGEVASDGVYFYIIYAKGKDKIEYNLNGTVTLLR